MDAQGWLTGASPNTTTIRVLTPRVMRAGSEVLLYWYMTSGPGTARLTVYAEGPTGARTVPRAIDDVFTGSLVTQDDYIVFLTFPEAGCWRLRGERANGKTFGDVWLSVAPR